MAKVKKLNPSNKDSKNNEDLSFEDFMTLLQRELGIDLNDEQFQNSESDDDEDWDDSNGFDDEDYLLGLKLPKQKFIGTSKREFHIRIKLNNAPVNIWRELVVPSNITLELLAFVLIDAMGWKHEHLYQFRGKNNVLYMNAHEIREHRNSFWGFVSRVEYRDSGKTSLEMVLQPKAASKREQIDANISSTEQKQDQPKVKGERIKFEYDFGDFWEHDLWVKGARDYAPNEEPVIKLLKAHGECPPEDCGGVWGYAELLELNKKKRKSAEDKERLEWYDIPKDYDPEDCDLEWLQDDVEALWLEIKEKM